MLAVSPPSRSKLDEIESSQREMEGLAVVGDDDDGGQFSDGSLLESIDFDDLFVGIGDDVLPGLEMDPELLAEFSVVSGGEESSEMNSSPIVVENIDDRADSDDNHHNQNMVMTTTTTEKEEDDNKNKVGLDSGSGLSDSNSGDEKEKVKASPNKEANKGRKSCAQSKDSQGKRKVKVDWTPELHRRFVEAVEQLGVEKAVPSRILEIMGNACLTRHNIASHLQKYRSHRKHMVAREAEAARWSERRHQMYGGRGKTSDIRHWGFPHQMAAPPTPVPPMHHYRPLHVWGHPSNMDHSSNIWRHHHHHHPLLSPPPPHPLLFWNQQAPNAARAPDCFPPLTTPPTRFGSPPVTGIPPHGMVKVDHGIRVSGQPDPTQSVFDFHPSKESIDAAIEDVLSKPWLPLPLGLKAPTLDGVLGELQRQGIPNIPPSCA